MEKLNGVITVYSNTPGIASGYGQQSEYMIHSLKKAGFEVAALSNTDIYETEQKIETPYGTVPLFTAGQVKYSNDVTPANHREFVSRYPDKVNRLLTIYDVWILDNPEFDEIDILSWVPLDSISLSKLDEAWLRKPNVTPIAMSPHGVRQLSDAGIECEYAPHAIDTKIFKPTFEIAGQPIEDHLDSKDKFVVGIMAANAPLGMMHRKAYSENLLAFSIFQKRHPDAMLYLHTSNKAGWDLMKIIESCEINPNSVLFVNHEDYIHDRIPRDHMAAYYTGMDIYLGTSYGEGFGIGTIEAQACGTKVVGSNWSATPDLVANDGWLVDGQPIWNPMKNSWFKVPNVLQIVAALENAYRAGKGRSQVAIDFAKQFDIETVWDNYWMPILKKIF